MHDRLSFRACQFQSSTISLTCIFTFACNRAALPWISLSLSTMKLHEAQVASVYKYFFLYIEPIATLVGAYYSSFQQQTYLDLTHASSVPISGTPTAVKVVLLQLSNLYFVFAINEALVLRATSDLKIWRTLLFCLLIADVGHLCSVSALGSQIYWYVPGWNAIDWGNVAFVYCGASIRLAFLLGYGVGATSQQTARRSTRRKRRSSRLTG